MNRDFKAPFYPHQYYHVFNHGVGNEQLFLHADNYHYFLHLFSKHICPIADVFCYCLLPNHFHFFIAIKPAQVLNQQIERKQYNNKNELSLHPAFVLQQFSNYFNAYTKVFNKQQIRKGKLFIEPFNRRLIDTADYYTKLVHYVHANPVHHGFCSNIGDWPYSSYQQIIAKNNWLKHEEIIRWFGSVSAFIEFHQQPVQRKFKNASNLGGF